MSGILFRHLLARYLRLFLFVLASVLVIFLVADFVDRAKVYTGAHWGRDVSLLYGYKALVAAHQLAPAALLLAAGVLVATLRRNGELTALQTLGFGRLLLYGPVLVVALVVSCGLVALDEFAVGHASRRVDEITTLRFHRWGDWGTFFGRKQWFRRGERIFYLHEGSAEEGFRDVSVLRMSPAFELAERIDAQRMEWVDGTRWRLTGVQRRRFDGRGGTSLEHHDSGLFELGVDRAALAIRPGRPEQMRYRVLKQQIAARREVGLPDRLYALALANRFAYPVTGLPAAALAVGLALRRGRGTHLTAALVAGLGVTMALWGLMVVARTLVSSARVGPGNAAWAPAIILAVAAAAVTSERVRPVLWARRVLGGRAATVSAPGER